MAPELAGVADEAMAVVERLLRQGGTASFVVHINPALRRVAIVPPDSDIVSIQLPKAA